MSYKYRNKQEWLELITECRQSGMTDQDWCRANGISRSTFYKAVTRLRNAACELPASASAMPNVINLTSSDRQDIVPVNIIPDDMGRVSSCPQPNTVPYVMEINTGSITIRVSNDVSSSVLSHTLRILGGIL